MLWMDSLYNDLLSGLLRLGSKKRYNSGNLFILDLERAPWGCGSSASPLFDSHLAELNLLP